MPFFFCYYINMLNLYKLINKILPVVVLGLFAIWSLSIIFFSGIQPGEAEAHAWTIAGNVNLLQLINLMNVEGHFLIWYLCIMPFAKFPVLYPWAMDIVNWSFCFASLVVLWKRAPFNNFIKICITFSVPFLQIYSVYPRCYSIGILFLFLALAMYKERLEKPYKYVILLTLAANTNVLALFGAGILGLLFVYENITERKFLSYDGKRLGIFIILVVLFNLVLYFFQFHNVVTPDYETQGLIKAREDLLGYFGKITFITNVERFKYIMLWIGTVLFPIMFWQNKKALIFFVSTEVITLVFFTFIYGARYYHTCFMFIFAIMAFWLLTSDDNFSEKFKWKTILFSILAINMLFIKIYHLPAFLDCLIFPVKDTPELFEGRIYSNYAPIELSVVLPHLAKKGQTIYDMQGRDLNSYEGLMMYFNKDAKIMEPDSFAGKLDPEKRNFIILDGMFKDDYIQGKKFRFDVKLTKSFEEYKTNAKFHIYEVKNIRELNY